MTDRLPPSSHNPIPALPPATGYINLPEVLDFLGISETTFRDEMKAGRYPRPYKLAKRRNGWKLAEIIASVEHPQR
jgi:predicted DNA-binding transcriptional regulator AlpA